MNPLLGILIMIVMFLMMVVVWIGSLFFLFALVGVVYAITWFLAVKTKIKDALQRVRYRQPTQR